MLLQDLKDNGLANVPIIMMTADAAAVKGLGMDHIAFCLMKPFDLGDLIDCVATHIRRDT